MTATLAATLAATLCGIARPPIALNRPLDFERAHSLSVGAMTQDAFHFATTDTYLTPIALGAMVMGTRTPEPEARRILDHFLTEVTPRYAAPDGTPARGMVDTADCHCWWEVPGARWGVTANRRLAAAAVRRPRRVRVVGCTWHRRHELG